MSKQKDKHHENSKTNGDWHGAHCFPGGLRRSTLCAAHPHSVSEQDGYGEVLFEVRAGDVVLESGMYHVQHVVEGSDHVIVFKPVTMPAGYKEYQMVEGREVVRLKCHVSPADKSVNNTKIKLGRNASGERVIEEIQIAGEKVKHTF